MILEDIMQILQQRKGASADDSYVARLYQKGNDAILKKIGEEAVETVMAVKDGEKDKIIYETADLWFHSMVMLAHNDIELNSILDELQRRFGTSGLAEKASRTQG